MIERNPNAEHPTPASCVHLIGGFYASNVSGSRRSMRLPKVLKINSRNMV